MHKLDQSNGVGGYAYIINVGTPSYIPTVYLQVELLNSFHRTIPNTMV